MVVPGGIKSVTIDVKLGVLQGNVLGPLLFVIHLKHIQYLIKSRSKLFADD